MAFQPSTALINAQHPDTAYFNVLRDNAAAIKAIYDSRAYLIARHNGTQSVASTGKLAFPVLLASRGGCSLSGDFSTITVPAGFYLSWVRVSVPWVSDAANRITVRLGTNPGVIATRTVPISSSGGNITFSVLSTWRTNSSSSATIYAYLQRTLASTVTTTTTPMLTQIVVAQIAPYL